MEWLEDAVRWQRRWQKGSSYSWEQKASCMWSPSQPIGPKLEVKYSLELSLEQWRREDILLGTYQSHISPTTMVVQQACHLRQYSMCRGKADTGQIRQNLPIL